MVVTSGSIRGRVAVVIATHAYYFPLERCLWGFASQVESPADVILVDNGSGGRLADWGRGVHAGITTLVRSSNGFFCGGYNEGLRHALAEGFEFALIVNADTEVCNSRLIDELLEVADRHPRAAFVGPRVFLREPGEVQNTVLSFPSFRRHVQAFVKCKFLKEDKLGSDNREREVEFLNGVCVLCRLAALAEIGLMDEAMGGYVEDTDWSWRARSLGWSSVYAPVDAVIHHQPESGYEHYSTKCFMLRRNTIYWHVKRGASFEAALYGWSSRALAWTRARWASISRRPDAALFDDFSRRLGEVDRRIRKREALGEWFGPPFSSS